MQSQRYVQYSGLMQCVPLLSFRQSQLLHAMTCMWWTSQAPCQLTRFVILALCRYSMNSLEAAGSEHMSRSCSSSSSSSEGQAMPKFVRQFLGAVHLREVGWKMSSWQQPLVLSRSCCWKPSARCASPLIALLVFNSNGPRCSIVVLHLLL